MSLALGASGVWVGTRFICAEEAGAPPAHQKTVLGLSSEGTARTIIFTGRPLRGATTPYVKDWEDNKQDKIKELTGKGILPVAWDVQQHEKRGEELSPMDYRYWLMGQAVGGVKKITPAKEIIDEMVDGAVKIMRHNVSIISRI